MPVPKRKLSRSRRDMRSANKHLIPTPFGICKQENCGNPTLPHNVCDKCGYYKGKCVFSVKTKNDTQESIQK
jgi:large subunit ribosomal protein L32